MTDIQIDGDVSGGNVNVGGTQHIHTLTINNYHNVLPDKPKQISVFLSYARADDDPDYDDPAKSFMRRLYNALTTAGFAVWWDRVSMPSRGEAFTKEIETAIRACQRFVLVVGPGAIVSSYVRAEWEFALAQCKPVTPILRDGEFESIPPAVAEINTIDCRSSREEAAAFGDLTNRLNEDTPLGDPIGVKALPKGYVVRHEPFNQARDALCADAINPTVISAPPGGVALYGLGGIGKSTMAIALANDCQVRRHYRDGVLWLEVGQTPNPISLQAAVGAMLGDSSDHYRDENSATLSLSRTLRSKAALIVLDDVWDHKLVEKFPIGGTACRLLITTRSRTLADDIDGADIRLNLLTEIEGARLIAATIGGDENDPRYHQITRELGGHTLAITLAAAQIKKGYAKDADDLLSLLRKRAAGPEPFRDLSIEETDKNRNLALSLSLSYDSLPTDDLRGRFRQTGIFVLESTFDRAALAAVWGDTDEDDARAPLQMLVGAGLLDAEADGRYSQHRLLHVYARALTRNHGELEETTERYLEYYQTLHGERRDHTDTDYLQTIHLDLTNLLQALNTGFANSSVQACDLLSTLGNFFRVYQPTAVYKPLLERALATSQKIPYARGEANTLIALGDLSVRVAELDAAKGYYDAALPLYRTIGDRLGEANTLRALGNLSVRVAELDAAKGYYDAALPLYRTIGDRLGESNLLMSVGDMLGREKRWAEAIDYYAPALELARTIQAKLSQANILYDYGLALFETGQREVGIETLEECVRLFEAVDPDRWAKHAKRRLNELRLRAGYAMSQPEPEEDKTGAVMDQLAQLYVEKGETAVRELLRGQATDEVIDQLLAQLAQQSDSSPTPNILSPDTVQVIAGNTVAVMTSAADRRDEWRSVLRSQRDEWSTQGESWQIEVEFADALLAILDGEKPTLPDGNLYAGVIAQVIEVIEKHQNAS